MLEYVDHQNFLDNFDEEKFLDEHPQFKEFFAVVREVINAPLDPITTDKGTLDMYSKVSYDFARLAAYLVSIPDLECSTMPIITWTGRSTAGTDCVRTGQIDKATGAFFEAGFYRVQAQNLIIHRFSTYGIKKPNTFLFAVTD